jgi:tetratricopeptide (TPR) repeat protein
MNAKPSPGSSPTPLLDAALQSMRQGDHERAVEGFRRVLQADADAEMAWAGLGRCQGQIGEPRQAVESLVRAGKLFGRHLERPGRTDALLDIVVEMHLNHGFRESLPFLAKVLKARPALARGHHLKAQALERLNDPRGALLEAARAYALAPQEANAAILLATLDARCGNFTQARALLEATASRAAASARPRALLELGRVLDRMGERDAAFDTLGEAGKLALASPDIARFDLERVYAELAEEQEKCTPEWLRGHARIVADGRPEPVFLLGFYRSGTTLLERILASHPRIRSSGEADLVPHLLKTLYRWKPDPALHWTERFAALGPDAATRLREAYAQRVERCLGADPDGRILLDKTALNTVNLGLIRAVFPRAQILFALRDPRDVLLSCFMQAFAPNPLTAQFLDWARGARFYDAVMRHWRAMAPGDGAGVTVTRYERLVADPRAELAPLLADLGLEWHPDMARFHDSAGRDAVATPSFADVARPLHGDAVGRWRAYARHYAPVREYLEHHVEGFGYASTEESVGG